MIRFRRILPFVLCGVAAVALAACGSSKKADPAATQTNVIATAVGDVPALPTIADPESIPLVAQQGKLYHYNISLPADWKPGDSSNGIDVFDVPNPVAQR